MIEAGPNAEHLPEVEYSRLLLALRLNPSSQVFIPGLFGSGQALTTLNWAYDTTPQPMLNNRSLVVNAGRVLGGSTSINAMLFVSSLFFGLNPSTSASADMQHFVPHTSPGPAERNTTRGRS